MNFTVEAGDGLLRVLKPEVHAIIILPTVTTVMGSTTLVLPLLDDGLDGAALR